MTTVGTLVETPVLPRYHRLEAIAPASTQIAQDRWPRRILVASDGSPPADAALGAAFRLGRRVGADVEILTVFAPRIPLPSVGGRRGAARCEHSDRLAAAQLLCSVRHQRRECLPAATRWPVRLEVGDPVHAIIDVAHEMLADLLVLGIGDADLHCREKGLATLGAVLRYIDVPLLAASRSAVVPARRVILVADQPSIADATLRVTLRCMTDTGILWVLLRTPGLADGPSAQEPTFRAAAATLMRRVRAAIESITPRASVRLATRHGYPVKTALALADEVHADLLVVPVRGTPGVVRSLLPNLAEGFMLSAPTSVLAVPDAMEPSDDAP